MAYILIDNFAGGVDRSRPRYVGPAGSLWSGINGHFTRGGDFEKRKAFSAKYALPTAATVGLAKTSAGLYVFGHSAAPALPAGVNYQQLAHNTVPSRALTKIKSWDLYNGKLYVVAEYENGDVRHFYDGTVIADWDAGGNSPTGYGSFARTHRRKVYSPVVSILWGSGLDSAIDFDTTVSGSFFQNMSTHQSGSDAVTGLGTFNDLLAVFSRRVIQIWSMVDNAANNAPVQFLRETGTRSPRSVIGFGDIDCFYLSDSGIRSLRARSGTDIAGINDVGTPIDPLVRQFLSTLTSTQIEDAISLVEPVDGRFWLLVGGRVFVFTYFPTKKISAWSWYEPDVSFTDMLTLDDRVYCRAGDKIYLYGGDDNETYDRCRVTVELPFLSGGKPGTFKQMKGVDVATSGEWAFSVLVNPNDETDVVDAGTVEGVTWSEKAGIPVPAHCTHIAPKLVHEDDGYASISQIGIHTDGAEAKLG